MNQRLAQSTAAGEGPIRTCVGCRERFPQAMLLRFQRRRDGHAVLVTTPGPRPRAVRPGPGRSAYLCPSRHCYDLAMRRRTLTRSLSGPRGMAVLIIDANELWATVERSVDHGAAHLRHSGAGAGHGPMTAGAPHVRSLPGRRGRNEDA